MKENATIALEIFMPSGSPEDLSIFSRKGLAVQGTFFNRRSLKEALEGLRRLDNRVGVYVIWREGDDSELRPQAYVGEGEVSSRLLMHSQDAKKDWWVRGAAFTSTDNSMHKTVAQYLEGRLFELATNAGRCKLENENKPQIPSLPAADKLFADEYLGFIALCLRITGVNLFTKSEKTIADLSLKGKGISAKGYARADGFMVEEGARAVKTTAGKTYDYIIARRDQLCNEGLLREEGETYVLVKDYLFKSPSDAAGVLLGRNANGLQEWKDTSGRTLKEIQAADAEH